MSLAVAPRTLIFDLDGTLLDSKSVILACFARAAQTVFPERSFNLEAVRLGPPLPKMFQMAFPGATENEGKELVRRFRSDYEHEGPAKTLAFPEAEALLTHCQNRGIALYVATNKPLGISRTILSNLKLDHFFQSIQALDSVQPPFSRKAEILKHLLKSHQLNAAETWFVGDAPEDAMAAVECGLPFIWAAYGYGQLDADQEKSAFRTIQALDELTPLLTEK